MPYGLSLYNIIITQVDRYMLAIILFILIVLIIMLAATCIFIGIGYLISLIMPFTLFQATALFIGSMLVVSTFFNSTISPLMMKKSTRYGSNEDYYDDDYDDYDDNDNDDDDDNDNREARITPAERFRQNVTVINQDKIGRNSPCPCGSGKKYKFCCGK